MSGEKDLAILLKSMKPEHILGEFVFCVVKNLENIKLDEVAMFFREKEGITLILKKRNCRFPSLVRASRSYLTNKKAPNGAFSIAKN